MNQTELKTIKKQIESEIEQWRSYLNIIVGVLSYSMGLACLGLNSPRIFSAISLAFVSLVICFGSIKFPPTIRALRDKERMPEEDIVYRDIMSKYFRPLPVIKTMPIFLIGWVFLGCITIGFIKNWNF